MSKNIFREEVIKARRADWLGEVHFQAPMFGWPFFALGLVTILAISIALFAGHYTRHERVGGSLRAERGVLDINAVQAGVVSRILVKEGEQVRVGQHLIEISGERNSIALGKTHESILRELAAKRTKLSQGLAEQEAMLAARRADLARQIELTVQQIESISAQLKIQKERVDAFSTLYEKWAAFKDTGVISRVQLLERRDSLLQQTSQLQELTRARISLLQQKSDLQEQLIQAPLETSERKNELSRDLADVSQAESENEALRGIVLKANANGVITNLFVHAGEQITAAQRILTLVPEHSELIAELWIPSRAIGFISAGNTVVMRYQAFPYQKFGTFKGTIIDVSRSGIAANEVPGRRDAPGSGNAYYRVLVRLNKQHVLAYGKPEQLRPGMELDADILVERRRLLEWIFEPLYGLAKSNSSSAEPAIGEGNGS